jgi:hypothetical protein
MSDTARKVRIDIRGVQLAEAAPCEDTDSGVFVTLDDPPPVRSILAVFDGDESPRAFEVTAVVEVPPEGGERGVLGRFLESDALARYERVGTEHLSEGEPESEQREDGDEDEAGDEDGSGIQMAMPAPVMVDSDESEAIQTDDDETGAAETADRDDDASPDANEEEDATSDEADGARKGKRRRGRKRR